MDEDTAEILRHQMAEDLCRPPTLEGAREILRAAALRPAWLVPGMVPAKEIVLITGAPGAQKSWLAYDLAVAVARAGRKDGELPTWLGVPVEPPSPKRASECDVLVLNYDNSKAECGRRFLRLGLKESDRVKFHCVEVGSPLRLPEHAESLAAMVDYLSPRLVLVDSLRQAHTAEENSSKEMMAVMGALKRLYACGAAVVVVHHSGKTVGAASKSRGSEEIDASATAVIHVSNDRGVQCAQWAKHRSWAMTEAEETKHFVVRDSGAATLVERAEAPKKKERVAA